MATGHYLKSVSAMIFQMLAAVGILPNLPNANAGTNLLSLHDAVRSNDRTAMHKLIADSHSTGIGICFQRARRMGWSIVPTSLPLCI